MEIIAYLGISQSFFAVILLLGKKSTASSDQLLITWLIFLGIEFISCALDLFFFNNALLSSVFLLINPAFFLYIKSLTTKDFKLRYIQLLHLLPYLSFEIATYFIREPFSVDMLKTDTSNFSFALAFSFVNILSWIFYNIYSIVLVARHRSNLKNEFSTIDSDKNIFWLLFILIIHVVYCGIALGLGLSAQFFEPMVQVTSFFTYSVMLGMSYILGFYGLHQKPIFIINSKSTEIHSHKSSVLSSYEKEKIKGEIILLFEREKPYLNADFNMTALSKMLKRPKHHITEVLNRQIGKNFFSFVNEYRITAVKSMLKKTGLFYSIEAIAYECGFSSKSTFYSVFKSQCGITPHQYRIQKRKD